jgi:hypothetical protein
MRVVVVIVISASLLELIKVCWKMEIGGLSSSSKVWSNVKLYLCIAADSQTKH